MSDALPPSFADLDAVLDKWGFQPDHGLTAADSPLVLAALYQAFRINPTHVKPHSDTLSFRALPEFSGLVLRVTADDTGIASRLYAPHQDHGLTIFRTPRGDYTAPRDHLMPHAEKFELARLRFNHNVPLITDDAPIHRRALSPEQAKTLDIR